MKRFDRRRRVKNHRRRHVVEERHLTPYSALAARITLDEPNPSEASAAGAADLTRPDRTDDDAWNRMLWSAAKGPLPYAAEFAGAHGRGLGERSLRVDHR